MRHVRVWPVPEAAVPSGFGQPSPCPRRKPIMKPMKRAIKLVTSLCLAVLFCPALVVGFFYGYGALTGINTPYAPIKELHPKYPELGGDGLNDILTQTEDDV